jgi:hypothetical protein
MLIVIEMPVTIGLFPPFDWPEPEQLEDDYGLGGNRDFQFLGHPLWSDCLDIMKAEEALVEELRAAVDASEILDDDEREIELAELGFDPGVSGVVNCLAAAGCIPFTSCNGGVFGGDHHESHPLVCFYCRDVHAPLLVAAAERSNVGLEGQGGYVVAYTGNVLDFLRFAREIYKLRDRFPEQPQNDWNY